MRSNYRRIGDFIERTNTRNKNGVYEELLGININKYFMPSVANVVGTDLTKYKVVEPKMFACNRMHVGRDMRLPIALSDRVKPFLVSPAYDVFEITNPQELLHEYLMMWFTRAEFDRNTWFYTDTDVRGKLGWDSFCDMTLPVPSLKKQQEIVADYNTVQDRIRINEQLNTALEETAQALYKHWFVDFQFPTSAAQAAQIGNLSLEGQPYKSSGGAMVYNEELDMEIPLGWDYLELREVAVFLNKYRKPIASHERLNFKGDYPYYGANGVMDFVAEFLLDGKYILLAEDGSVITKERNPVIHLVNEKFWVNNHAHIINAKSTDNFYFLLFTLKNQDVSEIVTGAVQLKINQENLKSLKVLWPDSDCSKLYSSLVSNLYSSFYNNRLQIKEYKNISEVLLSKMATVVDDKELK